VAALAALYVAAVWRMDKLEIESMPLFVSAPLVSAHLEEGKAPSRPAAASETPPARRARDLTQVHPAVDPTSIEQSGDPAPDMGPKGEVALVSAGLDLGTRCSAGAGCLSSLFVDLPEDVCGNRRVEAEEECDDGNRKDRDGCSAECALEKQTVVDNRIIEGYRIAGNPQIHPSEVVRQQMVLRDQKRVRGAVKMCLWRDGTVHSLRLLLSTGYREYDELLLSSMRGWRYRPYTQADGTAVTACTAVVFIYRLDVWRQRPMVR
jgi:cysteine-rich repeat protein